MSEVIVTERLSYDEARELTASIRAAAEVVSEKLRRAREGSAWSVLGYASWEAYVTQEFQMSRQQALRLLNYAEVVEMLTPIGVVPENEAQARPLAALKAEPEQVREAWTAAVETAHAEGKDQPTAKHVEAAVDQVLGVNGGETDTPADADEVDPVEKTAAPENPATGHVSHCLMHADNAISQLKKIGDDEWDRAEAFSRVAVWLADNANSSRKGGPRWERVGSLFTCVQAFLHALNKANIPHEHSFKAACFAAELQGGFEELGKRLADAPRPKAKPKVVTTKNHPPA